MNIVHLSNGALALDLCPDMGGAVTRFSWRHPERGEIDLMRPMSKKSMAERDIEAASAFVLTPFSNRVRNGKFSFDGKNIVMEQNTDGPHTEHGYGWQRRWRLENAGAQQALLYYEHKADSWPFSYQMEQRFSLSGEKLTINLATRNCSEQAMPYGFGFHPYFVRSAKCTLYAGVSGFWQNDSEVMPTRHIAVPVAIDPKDGLAVDKHDLDNVFTGWNKRAEITWPEQNASLAIKVDGPLGFLVVYAPPGEDYFCAEPVSNCTDAFNLATDGRSDTGMLVLEPGEEVSATISFAPSVYQI